MKTKRNLTITALLIVILTMTVGYSAFATQLKVDGTAEIIGEWNVRIANVEVESVSEGCNAGEPQYTNTNVTFDAKLLKPGDSITYLVTIENAGTINANLDNIIFMEQKDGSEDINFTTSELDHFLEAGTQTTLNIKVEYKPKNAEISTVKTKTLTGILEYVQK